MRHESMDTPIQRCQKLGAIAVLLVAMVIGFGSPASADPFGVGGDNTGYLADNHDHDYCWSTNFTWQSLRDHATASMDYLNTSTSFGGGSQQTCDSGTDVYFQRFDTTDYRRRYVCQDRSGNICDNADVRISSNTTTLPSNERRKTVCHEVGHSAGATHHSGTGWGCMISGSSTSSIYVTQQKIT